MKLKWDTSTKNKIAAVCMVILIIAAAATVVPRVCDIFYGKSNPEEKNGASAYGTEADNSETAEPEKADAGTEGSLTSETADAGSGTGEAGAGAGTGSAGAGADAAGSSGAGAAGADSSGAGTTGLVVSDEEIIDHEITSETITWNDSWEYADYSKVHDSTVTLYHSGKADRNGIIIAVNAGHGSKAAWDVQTLCHPDGSEKVTGGSTKKGATTARGCSSGTTLDDGTEEAEANLQMAIVLKDLLLENGYDVLMIREAEDCSLDNIARTVYSNNNADCHLALHYDSGSDDKGFFYISVPNVKSYRNMEPVASHYQDHIALGEALLAGEKEAGVKIYGSGSMEIDLTQTSYSTIPSVDLEIGDQATAHDEEYYKSVAEGILIGLNNYFEQ